MRWQKTARPCDRCGVSFEGVTARYCRKCRVPDSAETSAANTKYHWTPAMDEMVRDFYARRVVGRERLLAARFGFPKHTIKWRAGLLGVASTRKERGWTAEEEDFLETYGGSKTVAWIAARLKRTRQSVVGKMRHANIERRVRDGYTLRDVMECFGTNYPKVEKWIREGRLVGEHRFGDQGPQSARAWHFTDANVRRFVMHNPLAFDLKRVDQLWFVTLLGGVVGDTARRGEEEAPTPHRHPLFIDPELASANMQKRHEARHRLIRESADATRSVSTVADLLALVCERFEVSEADLLSKQTWHVAAARQVAMYALRVQFGWTLEATAARFKRHHSSAWAAVQAVTQMLANDNARQAAA